MDNDNTSGKFLPSQPANGVGSGQPSAAKSFLLDVSIGGLQEILISYANGHGQAVQTIVSINGAASESAILDPTGSWTTFANHVLFVDLPEGVHVVTFVSTNQSGAEIGSVTSLGASSGGKSGRSFLTGVSLAGLNVAAVGAVALTMSAGTHQATEQFPPAPAPDEPAAPPVNPQLSMLTGPQSPPPQPNVPHPAVDPLDEEIAGLAGSAQSEYSGEPEGSVDSFVPVGHFYNLSGSDSEGVPAFVHNIISNAPGSGFELNLAPQGPAATAFNVGGMGLGPIQANVVPPSGSGDTGGSGQTPPGGSGDPSGNGGSNGPGSGSGETPPTGTDPIDGPPNGGSTPTQLPLRIQAENATLGSSGGNIPTAPTIVTAGNAIPSDLPHALLADGEAYVDFAPLGTNHNAGAGQFIEWTFEVSEAGYYDIDIGYAFFSAGVKNRPMRLDVNGDLWDRVFDFPNTGGNDVYKESGTRVYLEAGENSIRLTANGFSGPNIDYLEVRPADPNVVVIQAEDLVSQQGTNTNGSINRPITPQNTPSNELFRFGAEGEAYLDWALTEGVLLPIPVTVAVAGTYSFAVTYANGGTTGRPLKLFSGSTDGAPIAQLAFETTKPNALTAVPNDVADLGSTPIANGTANGIGAGWEGWTVETVTIHLEAGVNNLILSGEGVVTGPNIDKFVISLIDADVVTPVNEQPLAADGSYLVDEDNSLTIDLSTLISDAEDELADLLIVASVPPEQGTVSVSGHSVIFTPVQDFHGQALITYTVTDTAGASTTATLTVDVADVNDAPVLTGAIEPQSLIAGTEHSVDLPLNASDVDGDATTLVIANSDDLPSGFTIVDGKLVIAQSVAAATYQVAIAANDGTVNSAPIIVTVTLTPPAVEPPANSAPVIMSEPIFGVDENGLIVGDVIARDDDGDLLTYELLGPDADKFTVSADGVISFIQAPDFENPTDADNDGIYSVTLSVSDGKVSTTQNISVVVADVNEAPTVPVVTGALTLSDAASAGLVLGTVASSDPDGDAIVYSVSDARFTVNSSGQLVVAEGAEFDFAAEPSINVVISAGDGLLTSSTTVNLAVTQAPETPINPGEPQSIVFDPNGLIPYSIQDGGPGGSISPDGTTILLNGNYWKRAALPESFTITENTKLTVTVTLGSVLSEVVAIGFDDDEDPFELSDKSIFQIAGTQRELSFVDLSGGSVGTPGQSITVTIDLSAHAGKTISSLVFVADDDLASNGIGSASFSAINLYDVVPDNQDPEVIGGGFTNMVVNERAAIEVDLPFIDSDGDELTYSLSVKDGAGQDVQGFDGLAFVDGALVGPVNALPGSYTVTVVANDGRGGEATSSFTLTVNNVNDAPVADLSIQYEPLQGLLGEEVELSLSDFRDAFTDIDGDQLTLTVEGLPAGLTVDENGIVSGTPTVPGAGVITIIATDPGGLSASIEIPYFIGGELPGPQSFNVEAEHFTGLSSAEGFYQAAAPEASGGKLIRTDANEAGSITTTLAQNGIATGWYRVSISVFDESDGTATFSLKIGDTVLADSITFDDSGSFDHPGSSRGTAAQKGNLKTITFDTTVYVDETTIALLTGQSDAGELLRIDRLTFTQAEGPSQVPPSAVTLSSLEINENVVAGVIGTLSANDPDGDSAAIVYATTDPRFVIDGNQLRLADGVSFDHETTPNVSVVITATDEQGKTSSTELVISIGDVNEAPVLAADANLADLALSVGQTTTIDLAEALGATDPDNGDTVSYVVTLGDGSPLPAGIIIANGILSVDGTLAAGSYTISAAATDGALLSAPVSFTLTVAAPQPFAPITLQAEDANVVVLDNDSNTNDTTIRDPQNPESATVGLVNGLRPGFSGTGYLDFGDFPGDSVSFTVVVDQAGTYDLNVRYASVGARPLTLTVNGGANSQMAFNDTALAAQNGQPAIEAFNNWMFSTVGVSLVAGTNVIKLAIPANAATGPNIDRIEITQAGTGPIPVDLSADADDIPLFLRGPEDPLSGAGAESINFNLAGIDQDIVKVEMSFDGGVTRIEVFPDADGDYTVIGHNLTAGVHTAIAYVTDGAGNVAQSQTQLTIAGSGPIVIPPFTIQAEDASQVDINDTGTGNTDTTLTRAVTQTNPDAYGNFRPGAVGNSYVDFGENVGDAVTVNVNAPAAGTYELTIRYANGGTADRPLSLILNGQQSELVSFLPGVASGSGASASAWNTWMDKTITVTLAEGQNTLRFEVPVGAIGGPNFDQFTFEYVPGGPVVEPPQSFYLKIEAETFTISDVEANSATPADTVHRTPATKEPGATAANSGPNLTYDSNGLRGGYEGTGYLDMGNDIGDKAGFNVTVEQAGTYQLTIRYANGSVENRPMLLDVDGVTQTVGFPVTTPSGATADVGWSTWNVVTVDVQLQAGSNTISLANTITNGPNIDNVVISREASVDPVETRDLIRFEQVVKINFEPAPTQGPNGLPVGYQTPTGYLADTGAGFGDRGNGFSYGWVTEASVADGTANGTIAASQPANAHWYKGTVEGASDLQKTYAHFEYPGASGDNARAWEMALENGTYQVTMSIGDTAGAFDSTYVINLEGVNVMPNWVPANPHNNSLNGGGFRSTLVTATVTVTDGRLTLDSIGGTNTEIQYLEIERIPDLTPNDGRSADLDFSKFVNPVASSLEDGRVSIAIGENGSLPTGIDPTSTFVVGVELQAAGNRGPNVAYTNNIKLIETLTGIEVPISVQISGGADTLNVRPLQNLKEFTSYTLKVQDVMDLGSVDDPNGPLKQFQDLTTTFVTGETPVDVPREVAFSTDVLLNGFADGAGGYTSIEFGPDGKLYIATITGQIHRWSVNDDGTIDKASFETLQMDYLAAVGNERRGIVGLVFDPEDPNTIWISDNAPIPRESKAFNTPEYSGRISKISLGEGGSFATATAETYITGLPRSGGDHLTNSLEFRRNPDYTSSNGEPEYLLYVSQGSNTAAGAADGAWGNRPERLLNAAILEIDPTRTPPNGGFNVQTEPSGSSPTYQPGSGFNADGTFPGWYNPYADDAVLKIFATGVRNAYDLVWHSNGQLYVPTNGTASGGKTPTDPSQPGLDTTIGNSPTQKDYFFIVEEGGYYGHPNPIRGEYILNGGNPTGGKDPHEVVGGNDGNNNTDGYQTGVQTDPNYDLDGVYDLGYNRSPNGAIEYTGNAFGANLKGAVLFAQFSIGDNIRYMQIGADGKVIGDDVLRRPDGSVINNYIDPLDIIQNPLTGQLYLMTLNRSTGASQLVLLTPAPGGVTQDLTADEGNDLAIVALDVSNPELAKFRVDGLDSDITTITVSVDGGPKTVVTLNAQKQFTFDLGDVSGPVSIALEVTDAKLNTKTVSVNVVAGEAPQPEEYIHLVTIQAEDKTPSDGTSVVVATGSGAQIQIRDASNPEAPSTVGTVNGLRPGAYGVDGNTDGTDGVPGGYADFGSTNADFITFNFEVATDQAGASILRFRYANGATADRPLQLEVNGTIIGIQSFIPAAAGAGIDPWNVWQIVEIPVVLKAGANSVTLRSVQNTGPNIDQLEVLIAKPVPTVPNDGEVVVNGVTYIKYEAENADVGGADIVTANRNQSGSFVDYVGTADQSVTWTISTASSGTYGLDVIYALGAGKAARPMTLSVNGVVVQTLNFGANSNAGETLWGPLQTVLDLSAGINVITLTAPSGNGPNLDFIRVTKQALDTFVPDHAEIEGAGRIELEATDGSTNTVNGSTVEFYFNVNESGTYKLDVAANLGASNGQSLKWYLNGVEVDISAFPGAGTAGEESIYIPLIAGQDYQLTIVSNQPGASALDYLDIQPAPGNPNVDIQVQSLDAAYFDDRLHFSYLENPKGVSQVAREFKDEGTVRISNTGTEPLEIEGYQLSGPFTVQNAAALTNVVIAPGSYLDVTVVFNRAAYNAPTSNIDGTSTVFEGQLKLISNDQDTPISTIKLAGFWQARDEGGQEPNVNEVWKVFGFGNYIEGLKLTGGGESSTLSTKDVFAKTDETEVLSPYWKLADGVTEAKVTQIAAFHGISGATLSIHNPSNKGQAVQFWNHNANDNQTLLPNAANNVDFATKIFTRSDVPDGWAGNDIFGISVAGLSTDPRLNPVGSVVVPGEQQGHTVKMFQALDANGNVIPNVYLGIMDYTGINYDYNDNMFVIEGVQPVGFGADLAVAGLDDAAADDRLVFTNIDQPANAQQVFRNEATFTITNDGAAALTISSLVLSDTSAFEFVGSLPSSIAVGGSAQVTVRFIGNHPGTSAGVELYKATLTINSNDFGGPKVIQLAGLAQEYSEAGSEPTVTQIVEAFGYSTNVAEHLLANGGKVEAVGDEVLMPYLEKLDGSKPIEVIQIAAFLNQGNVARLGFHNINSSGVTNLFANDDQQGQTVLPDQLVSGSGSGANVARGVINHNEPFGLFISVDGRPTYSSWTDPNANNLDPNFGHLVSDEQGHLIRFFQAIDANGNVIEGTFIGIQDYPGAGNYDYNDHMFVITNVKPHTLTSANDANGDGINDALQQDSNLNGKVDFFDTVAPPVNSSQTPYNGVAPSFVNGVLIVDASNFDDGGQGISWNDNPGLDNPTGNPTFRPGRDVELVGAGLDIGYIKPGEWVEYTINVPFAGIYTMTANAKTPVTGASIAVSLDGQVLLGTVALADSDPTGSNFNNSSFGNSAPISISLPAGVQTIRLTFDGPLASNGYVMDLASFTLTAPQGQMPYGGVAPVLGDEGLVIKGVEYDEGGQGVAYNDAPGLSGGTNGGRTGSAVEVTAGGAIGWIGNGEWLEYTVNVAEAGSYDLNLLMSMVQGGNGARSVTATFTNGSTIVTTSIDTPNTNNWLVFQDTATKTVNLGAGETVIRLTFHGDSQDLMSFSLQPSMQGAMGFVSEESNSPASNPLLDLEGQYSIDDTPQTGPEPDPLQGYDLLV